MYPICAKRRRVVVRAVGILLRESTSREVGCSQCVESLPKEEAFSQEECELEAIVEERRTITLVGFITLAFT
jgi:hypothetical protein